MEVDSVPLETKKHNFLTHAQILSWISTCTLPIWHVFRCEFIPHTSCSIHFVGDFDRRPLEFLAVLNDMTWKRSMTVNYTRIQIWRERWEMSPTETILRCSSRRVQFGRVGRESDTFVVRLYASTTEQASIDVGGRPLSADRWKTTCHTHRIQSTIPYVYQIRCPCLRWGQLSDDVALICRMAT